MFTGVVCMQLPKLMELVGLAYSTWFVYRYLLFKVRSTDLCVCVEKHKITLSLRNKRQAEMLVRKMGPDEKCEHALAQSSLAVMNMGLVLADYYWMFGAWTALVFCILLHAV
jgi:hypothetical protein